MLKQFSQKLYIELNDKLTLISSEDGTIIQKLSSSLLEIRCKIRQLREQVEKKGFTDANEEIDFFKYQKPKFYGLLVYHIELYVIETNLPSDRSQLEKYYQQEIAYIERFFRQYRFQYEYYKMDANDLDVLYFTRTADQQSILLPEVPEPHPHFSTACDYLFAKFMAMESLKNTLQERTNSLNSTMEEQPAELKWTGDKVNLAEIIYGIYFTGQINHGKTELATLVKWMGKLFQIDLKRIYSDYKDIRNRKVASPTRYLDQMRTVMHQRIDDENAYRPKN